MSQLTGVGYTPFSAFKISYSVDGESYIFLPEVITQIKFEWLITCFFLINLKFQQYYLANSSINVIYNIPSIFVTCRYLRIHITNVFTPSDLLTKTTGLIINQIYGNSSSDSTQLRINILYLSSYQIEILNFAHLQHVTQLVLQVYILQEIIFISVKQAQYLYAMRLLIGRKANVTQAVIQRLLAGMVHNLFVYFLNLN